jgi:NAD(P)H-dependent flavin oxidoreductase YrpB (nitropropane dioxygenase family)
LNSKLAERLGLKYPILQAPIGNLGGVELAAATSNAGGLGSMAITWTDPKIVVENIGRLRQMTDDSPSLLRKLCKKYSHQKEKQPLCSPGKQKKELQTAIWHYRKTGRDKAF